MRTTDQPDFLRAQQVARSEGSYCEPTHSGEWQATLKVSRGTVTVTMLRFDRPVEALARISRLLDR